MKPRTTKALTIDRNGWSVETAEMSPAHGNSNSPVSSSEPSAREGPGVRMSDGIESAVAVAADHGNRNREHA